MHQEGDNASTIMVRDHTCIGSLASFPRVLVLESEFVV